MRGRELIETQIEIYLAGKGYLAACASLTRIFHEKCAQKAEEPLWPLPERLFGVGPSVGVPFQRARKKSIQSFNRARWKCAPTELVRTRRILHGGDRRAISGLRQMHRRRIVSKPGQSRDPKSASRSFRSQFLTGFELLSPGTEGGDIQDVIVEVVQGASVANADYRRPPGRGAQQAKEMRLGPLIQRRGRFVKE